MSRLGKFCGFVAILTVGFFMTVFFTTPIVQSIWKMLVMPSYPHPLPAGYVYFVVLTSTLIKFKIGEQKSFVEITGIMVSYYLAVLIAFGFAHLYTYFL